MPKNIQPKSNHDGAIRYFILWDILPFFQIPGIEIHVCGAQSNTVLCIRPRYCLSTSSICETVVGQPVTQTVTILDQENPKACAQLEVPHISRQELAMGLK